MFPAQVLLATRAIFTAVGGDGRWHGNKSFARSAWCRETQGGTFIYLTTHVHLYDFLWRAKSPSNSLSSSLVKSSHNQDSMPPPPHPYAPTPPPHPWHTPTVEQCGSRYDFTSRMKKGELVLCFLFLHPPPPPPHHLPTTPPTSHPSLLTETVAHCRDTLSSETHNKKRATIAASLGAAIEM